MGKKRLTQKERIKIIESVIGKVPWKKFEAGIYNYCDRWCEKCNKTARCFLYWSSKKEDEELKKQGVDTKTLEGSFKVVGNSLSQTHDLITKIAEAEGLDLTITPEFEAECKKREQLTDFHQDPLYLKAHRLYRQISNWLNEVPALDIQEYREAYENLSWHFLLIDRKIARSIKGKKEAALEKDDFKDFELEDSKKSAWVAYRSTKICAEALELMDRYVRDFRIGQMAKECRELVVTIDQKLL